MIIIVFAACWTSWHLEVRDNILKPFYQHQIKGEGIVTAIGAKEKNYVVLKLKKINDLAISAKIRLYSQENMHYLVGDHLIWQGKLNKVPISYNPRINQDFWHDIQGFAFLQKEVACFRGENWLSDINIWKESVVKRLQAHLPKDMTSIVVGMIFGDASKISAKWEENFRRTGISHILAASGQNIFFLLIFSNLFWTLFCLPDKLKYSLNGFLIILYMAVVGFSAPVVRAGFMALIYIISQLLERRVCSTHVLFFSALIMLLINPLDLFNLSFQLSFLAVLSLLLFLPFWQEKLSFLPVKIKVALASVLAVETGLMPLLVYYFQGIAPLSILANIVLVPLLEVVLFLGLFFTVFGFGILGYSLAGVINLLLYIVLWAINLLAAWRFSYLNISFNSYFGLIGYYFVWGFWLWGSEKYRKKVITVSIVLVMIVFCYQSFWAILFSPLKITFFDVGQGDCILLQTPEKKNIVIDAGPYNPVRILQKQGVRRVDLLVITHFHDDHYSGGVEILRSLPVKMILVNEQKKDEAKEFWREVENKAVPYQVISAGDELFVGQEIKLQVLHPNQKVWEGNDKSLVLKLIYHQMNVLFTGDLAAAGEEELLKKKENLSSNVLKVGHHGSDSSTTLPFLQAVSPEFGIISVGRDNRFGHPKKDVLDRLQKTGVRILRTDKHGAVWIKTNGYKYKIKTVKEEKDE